MSRAHRIESYIDREEARLSKEYAEGLISRAEYNDEMRALQREVKDAYQEDLDDAYKRVRDEWGS